MFRRCFILSIKRLLIETKERIALILLNNFCIINEIAVILLDNTGVNLMD